MVRNWDNFLLCQENFWLSSNFTSLKYLFIFLFHLEGKIPIKTALKFQQNFSIVNKVTYFPKFSTVEKLITFNKTNKVISLYKFDDFCWKEILDTDLQSWRYFLAWYPVVLRHRWVLFCVIPYRRFRLLSHVPVCKIRGLYK